MQIRISLFAAAAAAVGENRIDLKMDDRELVMVQDVQDVLEKGYPTLRKVLNHSFFARNQEYVLPSTHLRDGDELAIIPPVSGG